MSDRVLAGFLERQREEGLALAAESNLLSIYPVGLDRDKYAVELRCRGLVEEASGEIGRAERFSFGVWFPSNYLREASPFEVLTWFGPRNVWHPNISNTAPVICVGRLAPGTSLVDIIYQVFEIVTWNKVTMREDDALNRVACQWARGNRDRFPVDTRPLKRRTVQAVITDLQNQEPHQ
jgi:hypothetical protein